jgi:uncharacterized protein YcbK (DUF882 family)
MPEQKRSLFVVFAVALAALAVFVAALTGRSQSSPERENRGAQRPAAPSTKLTAMTRPKTYGGAANAPALLAAAQQNATLSNNLTWAFGGKQQRGWYLYAPLISRLLGTEAPPDSGEFALALSRWQSSAGLAPVGVLDSDTLYKMVETWQSRRIKERTYPQPDQLVTAPVSDFWDTTRPEELRKVEREAYAAYKRMIAAASLDPALKLAVTKQGELAPTEKFLKIVSAFRSREYQEQLRKASPNAGRAGLAVNSPHFTARALDLYVGGDPVDTKDENRAIQVNTPVYKWLVKNAERFGFYPYYYEPWHWEYRPH